MNKLKRFLALFLVLSMMLGAVPFGAFASESTEPTGETAAPVADATEGEHESTEAPEETQVVEDTTASEETQATDPNAGIMTTATTTKPADGTTTSQPFTSGTGGSEMFRIPAIVTLSNGTLVAAADARWDDKNDRGNIDTIVSYSTDNGATWNYTFANYIADSGNSYNLSAATFIDPALAVKTVDGKETIYMLVDLFPGQTSSSNCIAVANSGTGFDDDGYLKLSTSGSSSSSTYGYYLKDGKIYDTSTNTDQGYTVDAYFNVSKDGTELGNLFTRGTTGFYVLQTSYLYLTKSTDGGATWSEPQMLNSQVKGASETFYGVGPGAGLVTSTGRIIFPCYTYSNEYTSVIYSDDNGATWNRSASMTSSSSEATLVEVDGRIYMFTRYGGYYYSDDDGATWSSKQNVSGISYTTSCQLSALVYSKLIDGQTAILLSAPTSNRTTGKIFVGLVNEDKSITWKYTYAVNGSGTYQYSSMAELADGSIGLLYENGDASITYTNIAISDIASGAEITVPETPDEGEDNTGSTGETTLTDGATDVTITVDESILTKIAIEKLENSTPAEGYTASVTYSIVINDGEYTDGATVKIPYDETVFGSCNTFIGSVDGTTFPVSAPVDGYFTVDVPHFSDVTISGSYVSLTDETPDNVTLAVGTSKTLTFNGLLGVDGETGMLSNGTTYVIDQTVVNYEASHKWELVTNGVSGITTTDKYLIVSASSGTAYALTSSGAATQVTITDGAISLDSVTADSNMVFTFDGSGSSWTIKGTTGYLYPTGQDNRGSWSYYLTTGASSGTAVTFAGTSGITINGTVTGGPFGNQTRYSYLNLDSTASASTTSDTVYLFKLVDQDAYSVETTTVTLTAPAEVSDVVSTLTINSATAAETINVTVVARGGSETLTIEQYTSHVLSVDLNDGETVEWTTSDSSVITTYDAVEAAAGEQTIHGWVAGTSTVTATIKDASGNVAAVYTWDVTVTAVESSGSNTTFTYTVADIENATIYYSVNGGQLVEVEFEEGETTADVTVTSDGVNGSGYNSFVVYVAPDEGYALVGVTASSTSTSGSQFYKLNDDYTVTYSDSHSGNKLENFLVDDQETAVIAQALDYGCDAIYWWSVGTSSSTKDCGTMYHYVVKLPEMKKEITSITHNGTTTDYTSGAKVAIGDTINYTITVYVPVNAYSSYALNYSNFKVSDDLTGGSWTEADFSAPTSGGSECTFVAAATGETLTLTAVPYTYSTSLTLTESNFGTVVQNGVITNTAKLNYEYASEYSSGTFSASASASAEITVEIPSYVIDFGLPVTLNLSELVTAYGNITSATSANSWGSIEVTGSTVTYTPESILRGNDYINLTFEKGNYAVAIYPATTVYYEEGFITWDSDWSGAGMGSGTQEAQVLGSSTDNYGYDDAYADDTGSNGTQATTSTIGATGEFTFTGTGIDVYANCTTETGYVYVQIKDAAGATEGLYIVDTVAATGTSGATAGQSAELDSLPIVSVQNLTHGTHTVIIRKVMETEPVHIDGIRIYNTVEDSTVFAGDLEDNPAFYQLRDYVLQAIGVTSSTSEDYKTMVEQVYAGIGTDTEKPSAVVLADGSYNDNVQDLLDNGPKNELFLHTDETLVFRVQTNRVMQIGLKAPNGDAAYEITVDTNTANSGTISSSTDMFYDVVGNIDSDTTREVTITITNTGSNILSVTDLKICDDPSAAFVPLTAEDIEVALMAMGYGGSEEEPSEPETEPSEPETEPSEPETEPSIPETEEPTEPETEPVKPEKPDNSIHNAIHKVIRDVVSIIKNLFSFWR